MFFSRHRRPTKADVISAYKALLDREPESDRAMPDARTATTAAPQIDSWGHSSVVGLDRESSGPSRTGTARLEVCSARPSWARLLRKRTKVQLHWPGRTLLIAGDLNAHRRRNMLSFAGPLQTFQLVDGVSQLAMDRCFVTEHLAKP
jgi:hypothetical protein